jgi:dTDP-4-amino-4,6-dideoxygalactose transaminase
MVLTDDEWLYIRAQNQHDTAACWRPDRYAVEQKPGELFCGQNYRMSEFQGAVNLVQLKKTKAQAKRYNTNMRRIVRDLKGYEGINVRKSNDINGDVGYKLVLFAADPQKAEELIEAFQAEGVPAGGRGSKTARDWHIYSYWEHIIEKKTATSEGCPFTCPYYKGSLPDYSTDMCPRTMDLISRAIFVEVSQWWTAQDCKNAAKAINKVCDLC